MAAPSFLLLESIIIFDIFSVVSEKKALVYSMSIKTITVFLYSDWFLRAIAVIFSWGTYFQKEVMQNLES